MRGTAGEGRRLTGVALLAALALATLVAPRPAVAAGSEPPFCQSETLHDYLAPLKRMAKLRELPFRGRAEPGFRGVHIGAAGPSLAVGGGSAGYQFQWDKNPRWRITVDLAEVDAKGTVVLPMGERHLRTASLGQALIAEPRFGLPHRPGFYRTTLLIRSSTGHKLAEFGNYYRLIQPRVGTRLVPERSTYRPGQTLFARLENPGADYALFGEEFRVERLRGETWEPMPAVPGASRARLKFAAPGTTGGHCLPFPIPTTIPPGRYRLAQETIIFWPSGAGQYRPFLHAEFEVRGPRP